MKRILFFVLVLPLAVAFVALMVAFMGLVLTFAPPAVSVASVLVLILAAAWFLFARKSSGPAGSESALTGHRSTKEGLL